MICTEWKDPHLRGPTGHPPATGRSGAIFGRIRLVNPDLGERPAVLAGRMLAMAGAGATWEVVALAGGCQYNPGRGFRLAELASWAGPEAATTAGLALWEWRAYGPWGVAVLKDRPTAAELAALGAGVAAIVDAPEGRPALPLLDRFEVWACDKGSGRPLALLATATTYFEAEAIGFDPGPTGRLVDRYNYLGETWRFAERPELDPAARAFQKKVNDRILSAWKPGLYPFRRRIFERLPGGAAIEYDRAHRRDIPPCEMPAGLLAEPLESERLELMNRRLADLN